MNIFCYSAWTKPEYTHKYSEDTLEKYISGSKRSNFLDAVEQIAEALKRRQDGKFCLQVLFMLRILIFCNNNNNTIQHE